MTVRFLPKAETGYDRLWSIAGYRDAKQCGCDRCIAWRITQMSVFSGLAKVVNRFVRGVRTDSDLKNQFHV
jgi:hypothetical protein